MFIMELGVPSVLGYMDYDYSSDLDDKRSTIWYVFTLEEEPRYWKSPVQSIVAMYTIEVEYTVVAKAAMEVLWLT